MPTINKSSFIRVLFIAVFAGICVFSQAKTASAQHAYSIVIDRRPALSGTFAGDLICVGGQPGCKNEKVVYVFESTGSDDAQMLLASDFLKGDVRVPIFRIELHPDRSAKYFNGKFLMARDLMSSGNEVAGTRASTGTGRIYTITITSPHTNLLEGTILLTNSNTIVRRIKLKRVEPGQVPPAPSASMYQSTRKI